MAKTILFIEDEAPIIEVYETALKEAGFEVEVIVSGKEAIERVTEIKEGRKQKPDLILLDIVLPDANGLDILKEIRRYEATKDIPVFILSNHSSEDMKKMGYDLGTEKYLIKTDYTPTRLAKLVKERLGEQR